MSGKAEKDEEVERMYRRRCKADIGAERASKVTELEAALHRGGHESRCRRPAPVWAAQAVVPTARAVLVEAVIAKCMEVENTQ